MEIFLEILLGVCWLGMLYCVLCLFRNDRVHAFRKKVLHESEYDPETRNFYPFFFLDDYNTMVWQVWKPLDRYLEEAQEKNKQYHYGKI